MTIKQKTENGTQTFTLEGSLNSVTAKDYSNALSALDKSVKKLVLDFDNLEYISSAGIRQILETSRLCGNLGIDFQIINVNNSVMDVFHITQLDTHLKITLKNN